MENLELGQAEDPYGSPDDDAASDALSGHEVEDGVRLNKRERKLLQKNTQYSDVI